MPDARAAGLRILVCGGRDYEDRPAVYRALDRLHAKRGISLLIHGAARGADTLAREWAEDRNVPLMEFMADWKRHGFAAGPLRNQQMLDKGRPDGVVAFPGGNGTADMVRRAQSSGLKVWFPINQEDRGGRRDR
ncbi:DprA-like DNA processing chain A [Planktothrix phage Pra-JY27]|nr:DNA binding protein [Planktothrix phage Pag-Yong1]WEV89224.1 DprA-like DNA processing chain A [Synechococcus phage MinM2]